MARRASVENTTSVRTDVELPSPVIGIDASASATGICILGKAWTPLLPWERVAVAVSGVKLSLDAPPSDHADRLYRIADDVECIADELLRYGDGLIAFIEGYSYDQPQRATLLGEVQGAIKLALRRIDVVTSPVAPTSWRKSLIGVSQTPRGFPKGWIKTETHRQVRAAGAPATWTGDQIDAFGVCMGGLALRGLPFLTLAAGVRG